MSQAANIGGGSATIIGGRTLIDGTAYDVQCGRTLIDGSGKDITFYTSTRIELTSEVTNKTSNYVSGIPLGNLAATSESAYYGAFIDFLYPSIGQTIALDNVPGHYYIWTQVAFESFDGSTPVNNANFYVNGVDCSTDENYVYRLSNAICFRFPCPKKSLVRIHFNRIVESFYSPLVGNLLFDTLRIDVTY